MAVVTQDKQPGLQINLHGHWVDVPPRENCLVVNLVSPVGFAGALLFTAWRRD